MKKTIFNVYVVMDSQEQCDRMKQVCIDNGLPIWIDKEDDELSFELMPISKHFRCAYGEFYVGASTFDYVEVTEQEFMNLLKEHKDEQ